MNSQATDIAFLSDFTHPQELLAWTQTLVGAYLVWALLLGAAGLVIALLVRETDSSTRRDGWLSRSGAMTGQFRLVGLALAVVAFTAVWLPVFGLLITYSGLTISLAALGCAGWLVTSHPHATQHP